MDLAPFQPVYAPPDTNLPIHLPPSRSQTNVLLLTQRPVIDSVLLLATKTEFLIVLMEPLSQSLIVTALDLGEGTRCGCTEEGGGGVLRLGGEGVLRLGGEAFLRLGEGVLLFGFRAGEGVGFMLAIFF